jgi:hypothetical protein
MRFRMLLVSMLAVVALPLQAQQYDTRWHFQMGAGWPAAIGSTKDAANGVFHLMFGALKNVNSNFAYRIDGEYDHFNASGHILDAYQARGGHANIWSASFDGQWNVAHSDRATTYLFGGLGTHYKQTYLTEPGTGVICDPWWGICYPVGVDVIKRKATDTAFGANGGIGVAFPMMSGAAWFLEAKYQWINAKNKDVEFVPLTIGVRW